MATFKGKSGTEYEFKLNLGVARRLASEFNLDVLGDKFYGMPGGMLCVDLAIKAALLDKPRGLHKKISDEMEVDLSDGEALKSVIAAVTGELVSFCLRLGIMKTEPEAKSAGTGDTSTGNAHSQESKTSKGSRSAK